MIKTIAALFFAACMIPACTGGKHDNALTDEEKKEGWVLLFDGRSMQGWHLYNNYKSATWSVKDGELICGPDKRLEHGDLVTDKEYTNYDLRFDWKINKEGNSGVFIDVQERPDIPATYASGPEYQILEVSHADYADPVKRSGVIFNLTRQLNPVNQRPAGEWNESRILQQNGRVEFYLNGVLTTQQRLLEKDTSTKQNNHMPAKKIKSVSLDTMMDKHIGKIGTPSRDTFEQELRIELLGHAIREARLYHNLTQDQLGKLVGVQKAQISKLENNFTNARFDTVIKVFNALHAKVNFKVELPKRKLAAP